MTGRLGVAVAAGAVLLAPPVPARTAPAPTPAGTLTVPLPPGTSLPPGTYDVTVTGGQATVTTKVTVGAPVSPPPADEPGSGILVAVVIGLVALLILVAGLVVRQTRRGAGPPVPQTRLEPAAEPSAAGGVQPPDQRRRLDAYHRLVTWIDAGHYKEALPRLTALEGTLPGSLRPEARFYIAFALYQLGYLDEAEHLLAALHREDEANGEAAYLLAYLRVQRRDFDGAEPVLRAMVAQRRMTAAARRLYGIVEYERALVALRDGNVEGAASLFERVERLGDLRDRVPTELRNRHLMLGARALLDKDLPTARSHFEQMEDAAGRLDPEQRVDLVASAKLGLALAAWIEPGSPGAIEELLVEAIRTLDPAAPATMTWPVPLPVTGLADDLDRDADEPLSDRHRMIRDMHFLRGMAVLRAWAANPAPAHGHTYLGRAMSRFACARDIDPTFADTYLVVGLLLFHLGGRGRREESMVLLREARRRGVRDPELLRIINVHDQQTAARHGPDSVLDILDSYLGDATVRASVREDLLRQWARFGRLRDPDDRPQAAPATTSEPSVTDLAERADLLMERARLLAGDAGTGNETLEAADRLARANKALTEQARVVEEREAALLTLLAKTMLS